MKLTQHGEQERSTTDGMTQFVPLSEIRRRVARIKSGWNDDTAQARAAEGQRRRDELESLLWDVLRESEWTEDSATNRDAAEQSEEAGFTIAG
jgi:hypothetical protein